MKPLGSILSPCKINLHLDVLGLREDKFHDLLSLFVQCDLYDQLGFYQLPGTGKLEIQDQPGIPAENNILQKAYDLLLRKMPQLPSLFISLKKNIPIQAGLGGGSSNGAAVLRFINKWLGSPLSQEDLMIMGAELGSDVPFFLGCPQSIVSGRGEILEPLQPRSDYQVLLINPGFGISTVEAFSLLDQQSEKDVSVKKLSKQSLVSQYLQESPKQWAFFNSFLPVLNQKYDFFQDVFSSLSEQNCLFTGLSGSGASVFAVFQDQDEAEKAFFCYEKQYFFVKLIFPLAKSPQSVLQ